MKDIKSLLKKLTGKRQVFLFPRCDKAIKTILRLLNRKTILIQDQGGWISYKTLPKKQGMGLIEIKTDYGLVNLNDLEKKANMGSVLLLNSMPGYHVFEDVKKIAELCTKKKIFLINDVSGSIGTEHAKYGDVIVGSFGRWKPVYLEYGGFLATNKDYALKDEFDTDKITKLKQFLESLNERTKQLKEFNAEIKKNLSGLKIIHPGKEGYNVIVRFKNEAEKTTIIDYCKENKWEYTLCPRYIRVMEAAVSIEVKRWKKEQ